MMILVLGGSGSGKSEYAENQAVALDANQKLYIATMYSWDDESKKRIERHRRMRAKKNFETLEAYYQLEQELQQYKGNETTAFLDCISNLVANEMYLKEKEKAVTSILAGIKEMNHRFCHSVIVSNDVFGDGEDYEDEMQLYLNNLATINCEIARMADVVVEVVCGIPLVHKGSKILEGIGGVKNETFVE